MTKLGTAPSYGFAGVWSLTEATQLERSDSGKVLMFNLVTGFTVTLPAVASAGAGWNCKFIVGTAATSNSYIITEKIADDTDILVSQVNELETDDTEDGPSSTGHTTITISTAGVAGDHVDIYCDGTKFYCYGQAKADGAMALA